MENKILENNASAAEPKLTWGFEKPFGLVEKWPKIDGEPEPPEFLTHCDPINLEAEMLVSMLDAYGIPCIRQYPVDGSFGKVILGVSGTGIDLFVPQSMLEDAKALISQESQEDIGDEL